MKNLLLLLITIPIFCFSQKKEKPLKAKEMLQELQGKWELDDNNNITFVKIIDSINLTKEEIYNRALAYFTYNYGKGDWVVQLEDKESGVIVGKGIYPNVYSGFFILNPVSFDTTHLIRIDVKDRRARVVVTLQSYEKSVYYYSTTYSPSRTDKYSEFIYKTFPVSESRTQKNLYTNAFYYSYKAAMNSIDEIEKSIRTGNTSSKIENEDW